MFMTSGGMGFAVGATRSDRLQLRTRLNGGFLSHSILTCRTTTSVVRKACRKLANAPLQS